MERHLPLQLLGPARYKEIDWFLPHYSKDPAQMLPLFKDGFRTQDSAPLS